MAALAAACRAIDRLNETVGRLVAWLALLLIGLVFLVVVLRYGFSWGRIWLQESYVWTHSCVFMLGAGYTLLHHGHVRIDVFYASASRRYRAWVDLLGGLFLLLPFTIVTLVTSIPYVRTSWLQHEQSREAGGLPDVWLLKGLIPVFALLILLQGLSLMGNSLLVLAGRAHDR